MSKNFNFKLITPEETIYDAQASEVLLPTTTGEIGILAGHEPLVTILSPGEITIKTENDTIHLASMGGFVEINKDTVKVLSDSAVHSDAIDAIAAEAAKIKAEQALKEAQNDTEIASASAALEKSLLHLKISRKKHHH